MRTQFSGAARPFADKRASANRLLEYLSQKEPAFYRFVMARLQTNQLSANEGESSIFDKIANAATAFYTAKQQRDMIKLQTRRAEQGLAPIDTSKLSAPPIRVQVDAPQARELATQAATEAGAAIKPWLIPGALILTAFFFLPRFLKR